MGFFCTESKATGAKSLKEVTLLTLGLSIFSAGFETVFFCTESAAAGAKSFMSRFSLTYMFFYLDGLEMGFFCTESTATGAISLKVDAL